jgi:hypothetical protein
MNNFEEQLATALLAKMAGSNLQQIDQQTVQPSSLGPAARIDPTSFLSGIQQQKNEQKRREVERLNQAAEQLHPLPPPVAPLPLIEPLPPISQEPPSVISSSELLEVLKSIDSSLKTFVKDYQMTHNIS